MREDQIQRYARHVLLPDVGGTGQERLLAGRVDAGSARGLAGQAALVYLVAAGVGTIGVADDGAVDEADVAAGFLFERADLGASRVEAARARAAALNPDVTIVATAAAAGAASAPTGDLVDGAARAEALVRSLLA